MIDTPPPSSSVYHYIISLANIIIHTSVDSISISSSDTSTVNNIMIKLHISSSSRRCDSSSDGGSGVSIICCSIYIHIIITSLHHHHHHHNHHHHQSNPSQGPAVRAVRAVRDVRGYNIYYKNVVMLLD